MTTLQLRPYQTAALDRTLDELRQGNATIINLPTGTGKTVVGLALAALSTRGRTLWLAHRDELIEQPKEALSQFWPDRRFGTVKAEANEVLAEDIVLASVQTVWRDHRLEDLVGSQEEAGAFSLVVVDEAHHSAARTWRKVLEAFPQACKVGLTATVERGDNKALDEVWDSVSYQYPLLRAIADGWLVDMRQRKVRLDLDLADRVAIPLSHGDWNQGALADALLAANVADAVADAVQAYAEGRVSLVFTVSVDQAMRTADALRHRGLRADWISGETRRDDRRSAIAALRAGELDALCNCAVLTEGFDAPRVDCVVVARPTRSKPLYLQMVGRGTRTHPEKEDLLILDVCGVTDEHSLIQAPALFGLPVDALDGEASGEDRSVIEALVELEAKRDVLLERLLKAIDEEDDVMKALHKGRRKRRRIAWVRPKRGVYACGLGDAGTVVLQEAGEKWSAQVFKRGHRPEDLTSMPVDLSLAQGIAEDYARRARAVGLFYSGKAWRQHPATDKQMRALRRWKVEVPEGAQLTKGQASDLLDAQIALARLEGGRR